MPGTLTHSPADILARLLTALGLGTEPTGEVPHDAWPVHVSGEPSTPDDVITVYDTDVLDHGREMTRGERQEHHGAQVRVRSATHKAGWTKANAIALALDQDVYQETVTLEGTSYLVHCVNRSSGPLSLGKERDSSRRLFTINVGVSVRQIV